MNRRVIDFRLSLAISAVAVLGGFGANAVPTLEHQPAQPRSSQRVTITARLEPKQAGPVTLHVQVVHPGRYVRRTDAEYTNSWRNYMMRDDGTEGDKLARDGVFTTVLPAELQQHRTLVRYFASHSNSLARVRFPAATNECPNAAYFVYDGVPAWSGASQPGKSAKLSFPAEFMRTMPAYHLIARNDEVTQSQWDGGANKKRFLGTLVYDGVVYDHIQFHNRGKASTHVSGKNKWGFKFNKTQPFRDRDLWGREMSNAVPSVSLTACASPWAQVNRGMAGLDEAFSFRAYQLAGVPSSSTHWIQLRVIDAKDEAPEKDQYEGDLWGLYQVIEEPAREWLREHRWPDGDIYSPESGVKYRAKGSPENDTAFQAIMKGHSGGNAEAWWRTNLNLQRYYTFHALNRVLSNVDVRPGANYYLYREPDGRWNVIPWDLDMMFLPKTHQPGYVDQVRCLDVPALKLEFRNRAREILDLFCSDASTNGGQAGQLVAELARFLTPPGFERTWPELDLGMWNWHPRSNTKGQFYANPCRDSRFGGDWTRVLKRPDFWGFCDYIVEFCTDARPAKKYAINDGDSRGYGYGYLSIEAKDEKIPQRPAIARAAPQRAASKAGGVELSVTPFAPSMNAQGSTFAALEWRLAEIRAPGLAGYAAGKPYRYEIEEFWRSGEMTNAAAKFVLPLARCEAGRTYRARARFKDSTGRWSHWSEASQFVVEK